MNYSCIRLIYQALTRIIAHPIFIVNTALVRYKRFHHEVLSIYSFGVVEE